MTLAVVRTKYSFYNYRQACSQGSMPVLRLLSGPEVGKHDKHEIWCVREKNTVTLHV